MGEAAAIILETAQAQASTLSDALFGVADELDRLAHDGARLEQTCARLAVAAGLDERSMEELQALDRLTQHLGALARYVSALAEAPAGREAVDLVSALKAVPLAALARRLENAESHPACHPVADTGDFELF